MALPDIAETRQLSDTEQPERLAVQAIRSAAEIARDDRMARAGAGLR